MKQVSLTKTFVAFIFTFCLFTGSIKAQFIYVGLGFSYEGTTFERTDIGESNTVMRGVSGSFSILARPIRNFGIGLSIGAPLIQRFKFTFESSPTTDGDTYYDNGEFSFGDQVFFLPLDYDYTVEMSNSLTFNARFFMGNSPDFYADLRYSTMNVEENYKFIRPFRRGDVDFSGDRNADIPALNIDYSESFVANGLGLSLGYMPHLSDYLYMDMSISFDYLNYKGDGFKNYLAYDYDLFDGSLDYVDLESRIPGNHLTFRANLGFGFYF